MLCIVPTDHGSQNSRTFPGHESIFHGPKLSDFYYVFLWILCGYDKKCEFDVAIVRAD